MTAQQAILLLGTVTLAICGLGLVLIHRSNPLLKGLNWMGGALVVGGVSTGLALASGHAAFLGPLANLCMLLTFVCVDRADRHLLDLDVPVSTLSTLLLCCGGAAAALQWAHLINAGAGIGISSLLIALQIGAAAHLVQRHAAGKMRSAACFAVGFLSCLAAAAAIRAVCEVVGLLTNVGWTESLDLIAENVFIGCTVALAFTFFWRSTTRLSVDLEHMASTDPLTRVYNRRMFLSWCESEQARSRRMHTPFSLLMVDFDHFKSINDRFGHHVGDRVLCAAVERIQDSVRGLDVLCRWGGEEFCVLLPNASEEATLIVAERVRRNIRLVQAASPQFADHALADLQLSASVGTSTYEGEEDSYQQMLQRADIALYEAKRGGRNRVVRSTRTRGNIELNRTQLVLEAS